MIEKGTLVVRIDSGESCNDIHYKNKGTIFKTVKGCHFNYAYYTQREAVACHNYRLATPKEKEYFNNNPHIKNISEIDYNSCSNSSLFESIMTAEPF